MKKQSNKSEVPSPLNLTIFSPHFRQRNSICNFYFLYFLRYETIRRINEAPIEVIMQEDESDILEFKSSLRWDYKNHCAKSDLENAVVKTVAAFLNTSGGVLVIGVDDNKTVLGLEKDYNSFREKKDRDGFQLTLQQILSQRIGADRYQSHVKLEFRSFLIISN